MKQFGTFFVIAFVLISLGIVGIGYFQRNQPDPATTAIPLELKLTVNPMAQAWMTDVVARFNASENRLIDNHILTIVLSPAPVDDMAVWDKRLWDAQNHPDLWLPSTTISVTYAQSEAQMPLSILIPSIAQTPLVWVAFADVAQAVTQDGAQAFDWDAVQVVADAGTWANFGVSNLRGNVNIAFPLPDGTIHGLMVLYSANAHFNRTVQLTTSAMNSNFQAWFSPILQSVPNFNPIGNDVASFMARSGRSVHIGIVPEALLLNQLESLNRQGQVRVNYPEYGVVFDFPLVLWQPTNPSSQNRTLQERGAQIFAEWLMTQQATLPTYGLRPLADMPTEADALFRDAIGVGVSYDLPVMQHLQTMPFSLTRALLTWFSRERQN